jgi:cytochrome c5
MTIKSWTCVALVAFIGIGCGDDGGSETRADQGDQYPVVDPEVAARGREVAIHGTALNENGLDPNFNVPRDFFETVWQVWDGADGVAAQTATEAARRELAFRRYGLVKAPFDNGELPVGFLDTGDHLTQTCLLCHSGVVDGKPVFGLGNAYFDIQTMAEDATLLAAFNRGEPVVRPVNTGPVALASGAGTNNGLGVALLLISLRDEDLSSRDLATEGPRDIGAIAAVSSKTPAWWNLKHKVDRVGDDGETIRGFYYIDGLAANTQRSLMNAETSVTHTKEYIEEREADFADMQQYLYTLEAPTYPGTIDAELADRGKTVFEANCSRCHGTYGDGARYRQTFVDLPTIGTDSLRLTGYTQAARDMYSNGWFGLFGEKPGAPATGYIPPPLDGVWATAPYFHNGSVPSLEAVLAPGARPTVWKPAPDAAEHYDLVAVGIKREVGVTSVPADLTAAERRKYVDTSAPGMSNAGHVFGGALESDADRRAVLEYLKTL